MLVGAGSLWPNNMLLSFWQKERQLAGLTGVGMFDYLWQQGVGSERGGARA